MSFGALAVGVGSAVAGAAVSSAISGGGGGGSSQAASAADPFASQRGTYQQALLQLIQNPSDITKLPGYEFNLDQGLKAVQGQQAAAGMLNSGNTLSALQSYGENYANTQLTNQELLLAQLAGANVGSPATAGTILQNQNTANQQAASALGSTISSSLNQAGTSYLNSGSSYSGNPFATDGNTYGFTSGVSDGSYGVSYGFGV